MGNGAEWSKRARRAALAGAMSAVGVSAGWGQTTASWVLPISGTWTDGTKWSTSPAFPKNGVPAVDSLYDAVIGAEGGSYTIQLGSNISLNSLAVTSPNATLVQSGAFVLAGAADIRSGTLMIQGPAEVSGGTLLNSTGSGNIQILRSNSVTLANINIDSDLHLQRGAILNLRDAPIRAGRTIHVSGGSGTLTTRIYGEFAGGIQGQGTILVGSGTLTEFEVSVINTGMTIHAGGGDVSISGVFPGISTALNRGVIRSDAPGHGIAFHGRNEGTIDVAGGGFNLTAYPGLQSVNVGRLNVSAGGTLLIGAGTSDNSGWTNTGTITLNDSFFKFGARPSGFGRITMSGGTLLVKSNFTTAEITALGLNGTRIIIEGNGDNPFVISGAGTLNNVGRTLEIGGATGPWEINGGLIHGGTLVSTNGTPLTSRTGGRLLDVVLRAPTEVRGGTLELVSSRNLSSITLHGGQLSLLDNTIEWGTIRGSGTLLIAPQVSWSTDALEDVSLSSGHYVLGGRLLNDGNSLFLASSATWSLSGNVSGGTLAAENDSVKVQISRRASLASVSLATDIQIGPTSTLDVTGGSNLLNGAAIVIGDNDRGSGSALLTFSGDQAIDGEGEVVFNVNASPYPRVRFSGALTLGSGITIRTGVGDGTITELTTPGSIATLINQGTISANTSGKTIFLTGTFTNQGTVVARNGGTVRTSNGRFTNIAPASTLAGGTWLVHANSSISFTTTLIQNYDAFVLLDGPNSVFSITPGLRTNTGTFRIDHGRDFTTLGSLSNSGLFGVGTNSTLYVSGDLHNTGSIDLVGTIIVNYDPRAGESAMFDTLAGQIGTSIFTSHSNPAKGIGSADNSVLGYTTFNGYGVDASTVLLMLTYFGDANLDGVTNLMDFDLFLVGYSPAEATPSWVNGDFDYNGVVDLADFEPFLLGYYALGGPPEAISNAVNNSGLPTPDQQAMFAMIASVPEPIGLLSLAFLAPFTLNRPRRRL